MNGGSPITQADDEEICPHCGAVLDLARALQEERSILNPKSSPSRLKRRPPEILLTRPKLRTLADGDRALLPET